MKGGMQKTDKSAIEARNPLQHGWHLVGAGS